MRPEDLQFSPDSRCLAWRSGSDCCVWRPLVEEQPKRLPSHPDDPNCAVTTNALSFNPESRRIATAHGTWSRFSPPDANVVRLWDVATGAALAVLQGHSRNVRDVSFSPDGRSLLSTSDDGSARTWDAESGQQTASFKDVDDDCGIVAACFSPDGKYVATGSGRFGLVRLWKLGDGSCVATFGDPGTPIECLAFTPCGKFLAYADHGGTVYIRHLANYVGHRFRNVHRVRTVQSP